MQLVHLRILQLSIKIWSRMQGGSKVTLNRKDEREEEKIPLFKFRVHLQ